MSIKIIMASGRVDDSIDLSLIGGAYKHELHARTGLPLCSYGIDSMTVRYDLNIPHLPFLVTVTGGIDL